MGRPVSSHGSRSHGVAGRTSRLRSALAGFKALDVGRRPGDYTLKVGRVQEREAEAREAKLERIREQVASGALVIRQMTRTERARWDKQRASLEANFTQAERTRRDSLLRNRRQRAERLLGNVS
jgi:hypothetical protein